MSLEERVGVPYAWTAGGIPGGGGSPGKTLEVQKSLGRTCISQRSGDSVLSDGATEVQGLRLGTMLKPDFHLPHASWHVLLEGLCVALGWLQGVTRAGITSSSFS